MPWFECHTLPRQVKAIVTLQLGKLRHGGLPCPPTASQGLGLSLNPGLSLLGSERLTNTPPESSVGSYKRVSQTRSKGTYCSGTYVPSSLPATPSGRPSAATHGSRRTIPPCPRARALG